MRRLLLAGLSENNEIEQDSSILYGIRHYRTVKKKLPSNLEVTAIHEAAHAALYFECGWPVHEITIEGSEASASGYVTPGARDCSTTDSDIEGLVCMYLAGGVALEILELGVLELRKEHWGIDVDDHVLAELGDNASDYVMIGSDLMYATEYAAKISNTEAINVKIEKLIQRTRRTLRTPRVWDGVKRIAGELLLIAEFPKVLDGSKAQKVFENC